MNRFWVRRYAKIYRNGTIKIPEKPMYGVWDTTENKFLSGCRSHSQKMVILTVKHWNIYNRDEGGYIFPEYDIDTIPLEDALSELKARND